MSQLQGGINRQSHTTDLEIIKQKRAALQKLVKLTSMLHQLHQGLQSVILMGKSAAQIPEKIVTKFKTLTESLKEKPTTTLKNTLSATDVKIDRDIKHVLEISQKSNELLEQELGATGTKLTDALKDDYHDFVNSFKKKSQASITLRITLKTRKALVNAFNLPVPESFIKNQIMSLEVKEGECRNLIKKDMSSLQSDVNVLLKQDDCPEEVKKILSEIKSELKNNSDHFESGKSLEEMPIMYESIELSGAPQVVEEVEVIINPPKEETVENIENETEAKKKKAGFFKHFMNWLKAPWDKGWKDTE
ncbi:MAG: hypothetical protein DIZ80_01945 [endosymbiont of Galathealinum brachiosum]|uniref:Uncharacterized protein n=1 Tax=endosymbiont of Galathealinum brachiosum TaxID=2200906 RepID=A0A370DLC7_9GAMM|nr:MAG: hypothetical protein DIZ80_01945 [endosymbiont of Galathealinum brachiosum]